MTDQLNDLAIWTERTYLSRLQLAKRLQVRGALWSAALVSASVVSAVASVSLLVNDSIYGGKGPFVWSAAGILILAASLMVSSTDYTQRSRLAFEAYRRFQRVSVSARDAAQSTRRKMRRQREFQRLNSEYQELLDNTVNHSGADFAAAMSWRLVPRGEVVLDTASVRYVTLRVLTAHWLRRATSGVVTSIPVVLIVVSISALFPLIAWVVDAY